MSLESALSNLTDQVQELPGFAELLSSDGLEDDDVEAQEEAAREERAQWLGAFVEAAYVVAQADGSVSEDEEGEIVEGISTLTGGVCTIDEVAEMLENVRGAVEEEGLEARLGEIAEVVQGDGIREAVYLIACAVAWQGGIGERQGLALRKLKDAFGFSEGKHQKLLASARG